MCFFIAVPSKGRQAWCWASYLEEEKAVAVPTKLFKEVGPSEVEISQPPKIMRFLGNQC